LLVSSFVFLPFSMRMSSNIHCTSGAEHKRCSYSALGSCRLEKHPIGIFMKHLHTIQH
jgi:hypothetical protein